MNSLTRLTKILGTIVLVLVVWNTAYSKKKVEYVENQVIVKFKDEAPLSKPSNLDTIRSILKVKVKKKFKIIKAELWEISGVSVEEAINTYSSDPLIEYIEPNYIVNAVEIIPNDPSFSQLWGMHNTGQSGGTVDADIDAPEAWSIHTGGDVLVGVIDTGVDYNHEDLVDNMWSNPNEIPDDNIDNDDNGYIDDVWGWDFAYNDDDPMDVHGHGTHCSGTITGIGNNGIGVTGVNWSAKIMALKFLNDSGSGWTSNAVSALEYATTMGVKITSNSWGGGGYSEALYDAIQAAGNAGALFIAAAGNDNEDNDQYPHYPSNYNLDNIISVASTTRYDQRSSFSNWGSISVDLGAPGSSIYSALPGNSYASWSGTSMATPHVSGAASLIWSYSPVFTHLQVKNIIMNSVDPISALSGITVTGGRLNVYNALLQADPDSIPPDAVTNLTVTETGSNWITLSWTASGDDGNTGTATSYDIRYSSSEINDGNFNSAAQVLDPPSPKEAGTSETYTVDSLDFNTTYFFALKVFDEYSNPSTVSNSPSGTTLGIPDIAVSPVWLSQTLITEQTATQSLTISNEGNGTLDFSFPGFSATVLLNTPGIQKNQSSDDIPRIEIGKGEEDTRVGHPVVLGAGGPDDFGYTWIDSDEPGGPVFNWFDISTIGTNSGLTGVDWYVTLNLPFDFEFYGEVKNSVKVSTNGYLTFGSDGTDYTNDPIPTVKDPNDFIAPFWDDLYSGNGNNYYYYDEQNSRFIIQYSNWEFYIGSGSLNFQVHLYENGTIYFYYNSMTGTLSSATIGIENSDASDGLQVVFNNNYVHDNLAVYISKEPEFLSVNPTSGSIQSGSSMDIDVTFDATDLSSGDYDETILISSNDPDESEVTIPAHLHVIDASEAQDISVHPDTLNYGLEFIGFSDTDTLVISNEGMDTLTVSEISSDNSNYTVDTTHFSLNSGENQEVLVTFSPSSEGAITGTLTITSNDPDEPTVTVSLLGQGLIPPDIVVTPDSLSEALLTGEISAKTLIIGNGEGGSNLNWEIEISDSASATWLSVTPESDTVTPGSSDTVIVSFDATDLNGGDYDANIVISSNDPDESNIIVPAHLHVTGVPDIAVSADTLNYGSQFIGTSKIDTLVVSNQGTDILTVSDIVSDNSDYTVDITNFSLDPDENQKVPVTFTPSSEGNITGTLAITSNDSDETTVTTVLLGEGLIPPDISVSPDSLSEALLTVETSTQTLIIDNYGGGSNLSWEIQISALDSVTWLNVSPESGTVTPGSSDTLVVSFDATGLEGGAYDANIIISNNDPDEPEVTVPVHLEVTEGTKITLNSGWNFVSWNIDTENDSTNAVLNPIMDSIVVALGFEEQGFTFDPTIPSNLNTLKNMDHLHGYELMMTGNTELIITGNLVDGQTPIVLEQNWNLVSYLSSQIDSTAHAISSVIDNTIVVLGYDGEGLTFDPALPPEVNTLNIMRSGFGYWIKTTNTDTLIYPTEVVASQSISKTLAKDGQNKVNKQNIKPTREWISLWAQDVTLDGELLPIGTEVKAVDKDGVICGECLVQHEGTFGLMSIYRDDPRTESDEGPNAGEEVTIYFGDFKVPETVTWTNFGDVINFNQILTAIEGELLSIPTEFTLHQNYPNPFNPNTTIQYDLPKDTKITIKVFNLLGKEIATIINDHQKAGSRKIQWDGKNSGGAPVPSGIYFYSIITDNFKETKKLILLR